MGSSVISAGQTHPNRNWRTTVTPQETSIPSCICGDPDCTVPYGYCHCGCGNMTPIAKKTYTTKGRKAGLPCKYLQNHHAPEPPRVAIPLIIEGEPCFLVPLTCGMFALINAIDDWLLRWKWKAHWSKHGRCYYAERNALSSEGRNQRFLMHREIMGLRRGDLRQVDHRDPSLTLDNRRSNLRIADMFGNNRNHRKRCDNTSGYKGVVKSGNRFTAQITVDGKHINLGTYMTKALAYAAYCAAAIKYQGEFARFE